MKIFIQNEIESFMVNRIQQDCFKSIKKQTKLIEDKTQSVILIQTNS